MLTIQLPIAEKILRTVLVYAAMVVLFRLSGKRGLASLNTFDFVVVFLLSNVVQNAVIGADDSLLGGLVGAATLVAVNALMNRLTVASPRIARVLEGTSTTVVENGSVMTGAVRRLAVRPSEIEHAVRVQNGEGISDVASARLEPDGQLLVVLKQSAGAPTRADVARLEKRLTAIEELLRAEVAGTRPESTGGHGNDS
nr:YetF domain-containing protein [Streptomyces sp. SID8380]